MGGVYVPYNIDNFREIGFVTLRISYAYFLHLKSVYLLESEMVTALIHHPADNMADLSSIL